MMRWIEGLTGVYGSLYKVSECLLCLGVNLLNIITDPILENVCHILLHLSFIKSRWYFITVEIEPLYIIIKWMRYSYH